MAASLRQVTRMRCYFQKPLKCISASFSTSSSKKKGLVLGVYEGKEKDDDVIYTKAMEGMDSRLQQKISHQLKVAKKKLEKGKTRTFYGLDSDYTCITVACIGKQGVGYSDVETLEEGKDQVRAAIANGVRQQREAGETEVFVDPCGDPQAASEGSNLCLFEYDELKAKDKRKPKVTTSCFTDFASDRDRVTQLWNQGKILADGQNFARYLMEMPANKLTPTKFVELVQEKLSSQQSCDVIVRDRNWAESQKMGSFLSVANGSQEPPLFLEIDYKGNNSVNTEPFALVGKGITFDTGGISLKPPTDMDKMRADMGGAACVAGSLLAMSRLKVPVYVKAFIPLCENMPSSTATRPGDVVTAMNGKTIQVDNTDAEGRLILADALCYAETFKPKMILDMATLTGAIDVALGAGTTGVFTNSSQMFQHLEKAGSISGDRVWRMPLFNYYTKQMTDSPLADINNIGTAGRSAGACTAAAFLKEFVTNDHWLHLDTAGVMMNKTDISYLGKGMSGRPTRTIVEFLQILSRYQ